MGGVEGGGIGRKGRLRERWEECQTLLCLNPVPSQLPLSLTWQVLYLFNRNGLIDSFEVRKAAADDLEGVSSLVDGMPNSGVICEVFQRAQGESPAHLRKP